MDLSKDQIDQLVDLELRRLERDYQKTIAADNIVHSKVEGTPNLDALMAEALASHGQQSTGQTDERLAGDQREAPEQGEGSWATDSEEEGGEGGMQGFQRLGGSDEAEIDQEGRFMEEDDGNKNSNSSAVSENGTSLKNALKVEVEEIKLQVRQKAKFDHKKVQEAMAAIHFPEPEWARG